MTDTDDLARIREALEAARAVLAPYASGEVAWESKEGGGPLTEADLAVDRTLRELLPREGEGWLSEETVDDRSRLGLERVWVVDPIDGTREFVDGIPEWCVSVALVEEGEPVAGGVMNPAAGRTVVGAEGHGVTLNGERVGVRRPGSLGEATVLCSRTETGRGEWEALEGAPFELRPTGSVAYKLALVAAGLADATWTLRPKNEWDVAGGAALVRAAGGIVRTADGELPPFNGEETLLTSHVAASPAIAGELLEVWIPRHRASYG